MCKLQLAAPGNSAGSNQMMHNAIKTDLSEADDDAQIVKRANFLVEVGRAIRDLRRSGLIPGRCAAYDGSNPQIVQAHSIIQTGRIGLGCESCLVQRRIKKVS